MNLNISFQNKDAAKTAFRAAGIPLTWNAASKSWQTSAKELPRALWIYSSDAPKLADAERPRYSSPNMEKVEAHNRRVMAEETGKTLDELAAEDRAFEDRRKDESDAMIEAAGGFSEWLRTLEA